jgi:Carboxypeptidase regulatory-like domain
MFYRALLVALFFSGALALGPAALAQTASLQGNVLGTDGRPLQGAEVRMEAKDKSGAPITNITGSRGHYLFRELPAGLYKLRIVAGGAVKFSVNIKMRGEKARIDFDLSPSAEKKTRNYVWVVGRTGTNVPGRWVERDAGIPGPNR